MSLARSITRDCSSPIARGLVSGAASGGGGDPTINTISAFEALSLTIAQFESNTETIAEFEAGLPQSEIEDQA